MTMIKIEVGLFPPLSSSNAATHKSPGPNTFALHRFEAKSPSTLSQTELPLEDLIGSREPAEV